MNDCLNRVLLPLCFVSLLSRRQCPGYSGQLVCQSTGDDKVAFPTQQLPDPVGQLARLVFQFLYEFPGTLNQQSSEYFLLPRLLIPNNVVRPPVLYCRGTSPVAAAKSRLLAYCFRRQSQLK